METFDARIASEFQFLEEVYGFVSTGLQRLGCGRGYETDIVAIEVGRVDGRSPIVVELVLKRYPVCRFDVYALVEHFDPARIASWLSAPVERSSSEVLRFNAVSLRDLGAEILQGKEQVWWKVHQTYLQTVRARGEDFLRGFFG